MATLGAPASAALGPSHPLRACGGRMVAVTLLPKIPRIPVSL